MKYSRSTLIGIATGLLMTAVWLLFYCSLKLPLTGSLNFILIAIFILGTVASIIAFSRTNSVKSFKNYFQEGFKTFAAATFLIALFMFIFHRMNPGILEEKVAQNIELLKAQGAHTEAEIRQNAEQLRSIFMPMMLSTTIFTYLLTGALTSLLGAGLLSQKTKTA